MDKKNLLIGSAFIFAAFALMFFQGMDQAEPAPGGEAPPSAPATQGSSSQENTGSTPPAAGGDIPLLPVEEASAAPAEPSPEATVDEVSAPVEGEAQVITLSNGTIEVDFTTRGGGIGDIRFLRTKRGGEDDFVFNRGARIPALALSFSGPDATADFLRSYEVSEIGQDGLSIVFRRSLADGLLEIRRIYELNAEGGEGDPYVIRHTTRFVNKGESVVRPSTEFYVNLGQVYALSKQAGEFLNFAASDGEKADFTPARKFLGSPGFLGIGSRSPSTEPITVARPLVWAGVKNQFYAFLATPDPSVVARGTWSRGELEPGATVGAAEPVGTITGRFAIESPALEPGQPRDVSIEFYAGPKEYRRLNALGEGQERVMQFGWFGFFSKLLLSFMYLIHTVVPSWGWSIVIMTVCVKMLFWPLTAKAAESQKRMQKIQEPMKELREKYKDNPQKMNKEVMRLFKENRVNPAAGCLPIFIQMPIFIGLFYMLRTASELRYAPFLWISDLSQPDTVAEIAGFPINLLPLIMGVTMFYQMKMSPSMSTADPTQQMIFKFLPFIFLIFLYNFSSGLVLYWTVQNLLTILQQYLTNRNKDVAAEPIVVPGSRKAKKKARTR